MELQDPHLEDGSLVEAEAEVLDFQALVLLVVLVVLVEVLLEILTLHRVVLQLLP